MKVGILNMKVIVSNMKVRFKVLLKFVKFIWDIKDKIYVYIMENKQHIQLPNDLGDVDFIKPKDQLVYVAIKKFMNKDTKEAFPSLNTLHNITKLSINTIRDCIDRLIDSGFIEVRKEGRKNIYKFLKYDTYEPFSFKFLEKDDLSPEEKAYLIVSQKYMFKDNGEGKISYTNKELSKKINMPESTISRVNTSLVKKDYAMLLNCKNSSGVNIKEKWYHLNELEQAIVFTLQNHEERIQENTQAISNLEKENKILKDNYDKLLEEINKLKQKNQDFII